MRFVLLVFNVVILSYCSFSQKFEGKIFMAYRTIYDTTFYTYNVKDEFVRIDEFDKNKKMTKALIVNLKDKSIIAINPSKKLYTTLSTKKEPMTSDTPGFDVIRTTNYMTINGYKCNQWRVRNKEMNCEITYWVAVDKFAFFDDLLRLLNMNEKSLSYFLMIPQPPGAMPMLTVERTLMRDEKNSVAVLQVEEAKMNQSLFQVPKEYQNYFGNY